MEKNLLRKHITSFLDRNRKDPEQAAADRKEREERLTYYQSWTQDRLLAMQEEDLLAYLSRLWAMLIWGNKQYVVDKMIADNGFEALKRGLADLLWGSDPLETRWNHGMKGLKGMGPAILSELLCYVHPYDCIIWNRRAYVGYQALGIPDLPRYNYQLTGKKYRELCDVGKEIAAEMKAMGFEDGTLLAVDYFIWSELQVEDNLSQVFSKPAREEDALLPENLSEDDQQFIHDEVRDAISKIGIWLGFQAEIEKRVADGSVVDAVWESTIGNMGRIIYVFEVQTKGSIDSLILNLLKARNNPAVQGVVAVSDEKQLEKIRKHAASVRDLGESLRLWDYREVWKVYESLEFVNSSINNLKLVPDGF